MTQRSEAAAPPERKGSKAAADRPGTRAAQARETRDRILSAALREFSEKGFEGASVRDISAAAGVKHGLIRYHFEGKEQLWKSAVDLLFQRLITEMAEPEADRSRPRSERLRLWIHRYVRYCSNYPEHARIMVQESIRDSDRLKWAADKHIRPHHAIFFKSLPTDLDFGRFPFTDVPSLIYMLNAATQAPFTLNAEMKYLYQKDVHDDAFVESYAQGIFELFFRPWLAGEEC